MGRISDEHNRKKEETGTVLLAREKDNREIGVTHSGKKIEMEMN